MRKFFIAAATVATVALGMAATTTPANAQLFFGLGVGGPYHHCGYYGCGYGYGDGYGYGWRHHRNCWVQTVRRHHHWVKVRRCNW